MRQLAVFWWQGKSKVRVGRLAEVSRSPIFFEWDKDFLLSDIELSPIYFKKIANLIECPKEPFDGLPGFLADCVPDGWGRILLKFGLAAKGITTTEISQLDALAYIGDRGVGALSFEPEMRAGDEWAEGKLSLHDLEKGIEPILSGTPSAVIETFLENGTSPNGMRPKIILKEHDGYFFSSHSSVLGDEWLIKFQAPSDPAYIGALEYIYSLMAKAAGLDMPETRLFESKGKEYFGVRRFDRTPQGRLHVHTLSGMLHTHPSNFSVGYDHFAKVAQRISKDIREIEKVIRIACFNILSSNQDDHTKNVAFVMNGQGKWAVAPAYDLTFHRTRHSQHKMSVFNNGAPSVKDILAFGSQFGFSKKRSLEILEQGKEAVSLFKKLAKEHNLPKDCVKEIGGVLEGKLKEKL